MKTQHDLLVNLSASRFPLSSTTSTLPSPPHQPHQTTERPRMVALKPTGREPLVAGGTTCPHLVPAKTIHSPSFQTAENVSPVQHELDLLQEPLGKDSGQQCGSPISHLPPGSSGSDPPSSSLSLQMPAECLCACPAHCTGVRL